MDPLSQGFLGAIAAQSIKPKEPKRYESAIAMVTGLVAGMAADVDILIRSETDPLLSLEYHRQFTHSLVFIPVGALIVGGLLYLLFRQFSKSSVNFKQVYLYALAAYATHGALDAATSYGTQLFWPFTNYRVSWDLIGIIDPVFTGVLALGAVGAIVRKKRVFARGALVFALAYFSFSYSQQQRVLDLHQQILAQKDIGADEILRREAKPTVMNIMLWRVVTETKDAIHSDAIWTLPFAKPTFYPGESVEKLDTKNAFPNLAPDSVQAKDIERFRWFSQDYIALHPDNSNVIGDMRYGFIPNQIRPLWGIYVNEKHQDRHVIFSNFRTFTDQVKSRFFKMMFGKRPD